MRSVVGNVMQEDAMLDLSCEKWFGHSAAELLQALAPVSSPKPLPSHGQTWRTRPSTSSKYTNYVPCVCLLYSRTSSSICCDITTYMEEAGDTNSPHILGSRIGRRTCLRITIYSPRLAFSSSIMNAMHHSLSMTSWQCSEIRV